YHGRDGCLTMGTCNCNGKHGLCNPLQHIATLVHRIIVAPIPVQFAVILWNSRSIHYKFCCFIYEAYIVGIMDVYAFGLQLCRQLGSAAIVATHYSTTLLKKACNGTHAD